MSVTNGKSAETYESLNIQPKRYRPHILAAATVVFGEDFFRGGARRSACPASSSSTNGRCRASGTGSTTKGTPSSTSS